MRLLNLRIQNFRNINFAELDLSSQRLFLLGTNGQGKSNLLEALGLLMALRSFRTQKLAVLTKHGCNEFVAVYDLEHDTKGPVELELHGGQAGRKLTIDGETVSRLGDFIGRFPVLPLTSGDLMLLRGSPTERRRFLDLTLSVMDPAYYHALKNYHRGIAERNRLLKQGSSPAELSAFDTSTGRKQWSLDVSKDDNSQHSRTTQQQQQPKQKLHLCRVAVDLWRHSNFRSWVVMEMLLEAQTTFVMLFLKTIVDGLLHTPGGIPRHWCAPSGWNRASTSP